MTAILLAVVCGAERTAVKDLLDGVKLPPAQITTVAQLLALPAPKWSKYAKRRAVERRLVIVDVEVLAYKREADGDLHVIVRGHPGEVMIAELPHPECVQASPYAERMTKARATFLRLARARVRWMRLTGVLFFDRLHGQNGASKSGIELHPLLAVEAIP